MILDTDARFGAIGAVLSQLNNQGQEIVIAFTSRILSTCEKGYCVTRKELLAVHEFMIYFRHYLYGKKFMTRTDYKAWTYMTKTSKPNQSSVSNVVCKLIRFRF